MDLLKGSRFKLNGIDETFVFIRYGGRLNNEIYAYSLGDKKRYSIVADEKDIKVLDVKKSG